MMTPMTPEQMVLDAYNRAEARRLEDQREWREADRTKALAVVRAVFGEVVEGRDYTIDDERCEGGVLMFGVVPCKCWSGDLRVRFPDDSYNEVRGAELVAVLGKALVKWREYERRQNEPRPPADSRAFPDPESGGGMSLRDYFAAAALTGLVANGFALVAPHEAYALADEMLRERSGDCVPEVEA